jgi:hypothetical protein
MLPSYRTARVGGLQGGGRPDHRTLRKLRSVADLAPDDFAELRNKLVRGLASRRRKNQCLMSILPTFVRLTAGKHLIETIWRCFSLSPNPI